MLTSVPFHTEDILSRNWCQHSLVREQMGHPVSLFLSDFAFKRRNSIPLLREQTRSSLFAAESSHTLYRVILVAWHLNWVDFDLGGSPDTEAKLPAAQAGWQNSSNVSQQIPFPYQMKHPVLSHATRCRQCRVSSDCLTDARATWISLGLVQLAH